MFRELSFTTVVAGLVYLGVVAVLSVAALLQGSHDALTALIAIASPGAGAAAAIALVRPRPVDTPPAA